MTDDDVILREKARELVRAADLAGRRRHIWGGSSAGVECMLCGARITQAEVELEVDFGGDDDGGLSGAHFHVHCFSVLETELLVVEARARMAPECRRQDEPRS
jgi:hypothetical protein